MTEPRLVPIPTTHVDGLWPLLLPDLSKICERGGFDPDQTKARAKGGYVQLHMVWDDAEKAVLAVGVTELKVLDNGERQCWFLGCAGRERVRWQHLMADMEAWARDHQNCARLVLLSPKGWGRIFPDFKMTHVVLEKTLEAKP